MKDIKHINLLSKDMREILTRELNAGNKVETTFIGGYRQLASDHLFVILKEPFKVEAKKEYDNIEYREVNNPSLWKAQYKDLDNDQTIGCYFGKEFYN